MVYSFEINSEPMLLVWRCELRQSDNTVLLSRSEITFNSAAETHK
ncbi:hypothetical protein NP493_142g01000 [Ridgeia piscesae]|uniref:Uncharacterized protein n=1 Tax=Ridgeia piscesae TaxID=27915 RepID=A0AAD9P4U3_RIDPI|nr:hypothetical protein NP493_142g01000 [Ridgeia piscesae]